MSKKATRERIKSRIQKKKKITPKAKRVNKPFFLKDMARKISVKIIGIGGGGNSIVSGIAPRIKKGRVRFVVANTDLQSLIKSGTTSKIKRFQFGEMLTSGLGTGMDVELAKEAALNERERIKELLSGSDLCIIIACLGGGAGSGAAPVFAKISKKLENITYGIFTLPFKFEGEKKAEIAKTSLRELRPFVNAFSVIPNERIFKFIDKKTPLKQALSIINKSLAESLEGLIKMIYLPGVVNIDFADFKTIMEGKNKLAYLSTAWARGEGRAEEIAQKVISNPLYSYNISGARRVLFNITASKNLGLNEVGMISRRIFESAKKDAKIIFGVSQEKKIGDQIRATLLAIGCKGTSLLSKRPKKSRAKPVPKKKKEAEAIEKKEKKESKVPKKSKKRKTKTKKVASRKKRKSSFPQQLKKEKESLSVSSKDKKKAKIRRNALQVKKAAEEIEKEILRKEEIWETPAFLRREKSGESLGS